VRTSCCCNRVERASSGRAVLKVRAAASRSATLLHHSPIVAAVVHLFVSRKRSTKYKNEAAAVASCDRHAAVRRPCLLSRRRARQLPITMDSTSEDVAAAVATKMVQSAVSGGSLQYLNPDYIPPSVSDVVVVVRSPTLVFRIEFCLTVFRSFKKSSLWVVLVSYYSYCC